MQKMNAKDVFDRLKTSLKIQNDKELAEKYGWNYHTLRTWIQRNSIPYNLVIQIAQKEKISLDELFCSVERVQNSNFYVSNALKMSIVAQRERIKSVLYDELINDLATKDGKIASLARHYKMLKFLTEHEPEFLDEASADKSSRYEYNSLELNDFAIKINLYNIGAVQAYLYEWLDHQHGVDSFIRNLITTLDGVKDGQNE